jgi:hypothetical protein
MMVNLVSPVLSSRLMSPQVSLTGGFRKTPKKSPLETFELSKAKGV